MKRMSHILIAATLILGVTTFTKTASAHGPQPIIKVTGWGYHGGYGYRPRYRGYYAPRGRYYGYAPRRRYYGHAPRYYGGYGYRGYYGSRSFGGSSYRGSSSTVRAREYNR